VTLHRCLNYLDANRIRYAHTTHFPANTALDVAAAEHMSPHCWAKTIVFGCNKGHVNEGLCSLSEEQSTRETS
jgi:hypothetical protein